MAASSSVKNRLRNIDEASNSADEASNSADEASLSVDDGAEPVAVAPSAASRETEAPRGAPLDDSQLQAGYANFCSVRRTIEEVILDFGLTTEFMGPSRYPVKLNQRVVVSYFTAKRLMEALKISLQQHEAVFGAVETDARKRARIRKPAAAAEA